METNLTDGLTVTVIGVGTVFTALAALNLLVNGLIRLNDPNRGSKRAADAVDSEASLTPTEGKAAARSDGEADSAPVAEEEVDLTEIALAAYATHRRHRLDRGSANPITEWVHAGRARASSPFRR